MKWLMENKNMTQEDAQETVMNEFSAVLATANAPECVPSACWNPAQVCEGSTAEERMTWLMTNEKRPQCVHEKQYDVLAGLWRAPWLW